MDIVRTPHAAQWEHAITPIPQEVSLRQALIVLSRIIIAPTTLILFVLKLGVQKQETSCPVVGWEKCVWIQIAPEITTPQDIHAPQAATEPTLGCPTSTDYVTVWLLPVGTALTTSAVTKLLALIRTFKLLFLVVIVLIWLVLVIVILAIVLINLIILQRTGIIQEI